MPNIKRRSRLCLSDEYDVFHTTQYYDERLHRLKISFWTTIPISNSFAAAAISLYMTTEHSTIGIFDPDLFIGDLVEHRLNYCSSFLVNAILCYAVVCFEQGTSFDKTLTRISNHSLRFVLMLLLSDSLFGLRTQNHGKRIVGQRSY